MAPLNLRGFGQLIQKKRNNNFVPLQWYQEMKFISLKTKTEEARRRNNEIYFFRK